ncbi:MAG: hypothetical protein LC775_15240, partial [Acidobacteria bacterium]|nr:hypothetical protein [Acidobacteriota bacterium]
PGEKYCLILGPFGHGGAALFPGQPYWQTFQMLTLEQVVARSISEAFGMKTYAIVDQKQEFGPPGPAYLRASGDEWQDVVTFLIRQAHSILLLLPPPGREREEIRRAFEWELQQITGRNRQSRVIAVLPPWTNGDHGRAYNSARDQACVIMAAMEGFAGSVDQVDRLKIAHYERVIPANTLLVKIQRDDGPLFWHTPYRWMMASCKVYTEAIAAAVKMNDVLLSSD